MINSKVSSSIDKSLIQDGFECLAKKNIFFGHQSVGHNIIDGINDILAALPESRLNIQETRDLKRIVSPVFAHCCVGKNKNPISKCNDFKSILDGGVGCKADIAFLKFCYVDIDAKSDLVGILKHYASMICILKMEFPNVTFVHFTVPLSVSEGTNSVKAYVKRVLKRNFFNEADNLARKKYNNMLFGRYGDDGTIFDLSRFESTWPDGKVYINGFKNMEYYSLIPEYSDDGGHLNIVGRDIVACKLIRFLSNLCKRGST